MKRNTTSAEPNAKYMEMHTSCIRLNLMSLRLYKVSALNNLYKMIRL